MTIKLNDIVYLCWSLGETTHRPPTYIPVDVDDVIDRFARLGAHRVTDWRFCRLLTAVILAV